MTGDERDDVPAEETDVAEETWIDREWTLDEDPAPPDAAPVDRVLR